MSQLTLGFVPDNFDDTNRLEIAVETEHFSGCGWSWTDRASLVAFASRLSGYPIAPDQPAIFSMGYNRLEADDLMGRIEIGPADHRGNLFVKVEVADPDHRWRRVRAEFGTHYPNLEKFLAQMSRMLGGDSETAVLVGD